LRRGRHVFSKLSREAITKIRNAARLAAARIRPKLGMPPRRAPYIEFNPIARAAAESRLTRLTPLLKQAAKGTIIFGGFTGGQYAIQAIIDACEKQNFEDFSDNQLADIATSLVYKKLSEDKLNAEKDDLIVRVNLENVKRQMEEEEEKIRIFEEEEARFQKAIAEADDSKTSEEEKKRVKTKLREEWRQELEVKREDELNEKLQKEKHQFQHDLHIARLAAEEKKKIDEERQKEEKDDDDREERQKEEKKKEDRRIRENKLLQLEAAKRAKENEEKQILLGNEKKKKQQR